MSHGILCVSGHFCPETHQS